MYNWYKKANYCVAYLSDVTSPVDWNDSDNTSAWFTRGWTLQELLAPRKIIFCDSKWQILGHICTHCESATFRIVCSRQDGGNGQSLTAEISCITAIPSRSLTSFRPDSWEPCVAQRMSWAARRRCTRKEDLAYRLLGVFNVNMPLLYGEGNNAFLRLQEEIVRRSTDQSIFAWKAPAQYPYLGMLARDPSWFLTSSNVFTVPSKRYLKRSYTITNNGIELTTRLTRLTTPDELSSFYVLYLNCTTEGPPEYLRDKKPVSVISVTLMAANAEHTHFMRIHPEDPRIPIKSINDDQIERVIYVHPA